MQICAIVLLVLASSATASAQVDALGDPTDGALPRVSEAGPSDTSSLDAADDLAVTATFLYGAAILLRLGGIAGSVASAVAFHECTNGTLSYQACEGWLVSTIVAAALSMSAIALVVPAVRVDVHSNERRGDVLIAPAIGPSSAAILVSGRF